MGSAGKWDRWYSLLEGEPEPYGDSDTYRLGVEWLAPCALIADWGCGKGWLRTLVEPERYFGVDGSASPFADVVADLAGYRAETPGIFMRHVLEHDWRWAKILDNAVASFTQRMALITFTPAVDETHDVEWEVDPGVPNIAFAPADMIGRFRDATWTAETMPSPTKYGTETIYRLERA